MFLKCYVLEIMFTNENIITSKKKRVLAFKEFIIKLERQITKQVIIINL